MHCINYTLLQEIVLNYPQYYPYTPGVKPFSFLSWVIRYEMDLRKNISISKTIFERMLCRNDDLALVYVDNYSSLADYVMVTEKIQNQYYEFYAMLMNRKVKLIFFVNWMNS